MNTAIIVIMSFAVGLIYGMIMFGCPTHALDYNDPRFNDGYMQRQEQQQRMQELERKQQQLEWNKKPCP